MNKMIFDFGAGNLCLDFANTKEWHASQNPIEHINDFEDFTAWSEQAHLISSEAARRLRQQATQKPEKFTALLEQAIHLRESIYTIFSRKYAGKSISENELIFLNSVIQQAMSHLLLVPIDGKIGWDWNPKSDATHRILWSVARSAADLLSSERIDLVRECEDDRGCGYLFIDLSKNHSRRWCSMESCGNRAKAQRHYKKVKKSSPKKISVTAIS
jgi:predicted RNA-binding Zn ribbon-like protein